MFNLDSEMILAISSFIFFFSIFVFMPSFSFENFISEIVIAKLNTSYINLINNVGIPAKNHRNNLKNFIGTEHTESLIAINVLNYAKGK